MDPAVYAAKCSSPYLLFLSDNNLSPRKGHRIWKELDNTQCTHYKMLSEQVRAILKDAYPRLAVHHADKADIRELAKEACRNLGINVVQPDLWDEILETQFFQEDDPPATFALSRSKMSMSTATSSSSSNWAMDVAKKIRNRRNGYWIFYHLACAKWEDPSRTGITKVWRSMTHAEREPFSQLADTINKEAFGHEPPSRHCTPRKATTHKKAPYANLPSSRGRRSATTSHGAPPDTELMDQVSQRVQDVCSDYGIELGGPDIGDVTMGYDTMPPLSSPFHAYPGFDLITDDNYSRQAYLEECARLGRTPWTESPQQMTMCCPDLEFVPRPPTPS
ncbi:hypothetical protein EW146_g5128 [Bondarzewia mesenterica]|uniref:Uncharacterized protein n=1 Tax=Bondarzewia mesenterica TaxID=1095465 RepID=A0A4S4LSF5_9AGAM|nr:hypothetical protein EW146_g5128 [Bondarzewia mesenterica]